jgi:hypothetical protein
VEVLVGISRLTRVSRGTDVAIGLPDVGVSGGGVRISGGGSVVWEAGRLQDDTPMRAAARAIQNRFLMLSSFSSRILISGSHYYNRAYHLYLALQ